MTMTIFQEYATLQRQIKTLQAQADALKPKVIAAMPDKRYTDKDGSQFSLSTRKKWTYTAAVVEAEEMLKGMKKAEEKSGAARYEESAPILTLKLI